MTNWRRWLAGAATLVLASACTLEADGAGAGADGNAYHPRIPPNTDPSDAFDNLEARLLSAHAIDIAFRISSSGAFRSRLHGTLHLAGPRDVRVQATGVVGSDSVHLHLSSHGRVLRYGNGALKEAPAPTDLVSVVIVGMTRLGLLPILLDLVENAPPGPGDPDRVTVSDFSTGTANRSDQMPVGFHIAIEGIPAGYGTLWLDRIRGMPLRRFQVVQVPNGTLRVTEAYRSVNIED